jgi:ParB family chromosome partitioning protein
MSKNRNLLSGIADRVINTLDELTDGHSTSERRPEPLAANLSGITNPRAPGQPDSKIQKTAIQRLIWVDPAVCRPWAHHNRAYELLNEDRCADLIAGFRSVGRQQRPAIVRPLNGDIRRDGQGREHDFEIISGARRHWTVSWLRARNELNGDSEPFLFLLAVRDDLSDAEAFELSDAENRGQKDISDFERAKEYRWALENLYGSNVSRMADAIQMDRSQLTRMIALTEMPDILVRAYPSILDIRLHHWNSAPISRAKRRLSRMLPSECLLVQNRLFSHARIVAPRYQQMARRQHRYLSLP